MSPDRVKEILNKIRKVKIAVYGDFCLDAYWIMDPRGSEISLETGLKAEAVQQQYYSPGGASNIVANLAALDPETIMAIGVLGDDIFGRELKLQLEKLNVNTSRLIIQKEHFDTYAFSKRITNDEEGPRIDFGTYNQRSQKTDRQLLKGLGHALEYCDILIFNQQVPWSITNDSFIKEANRLFESYSDKLVLLDSRHYNERFRNVCRKINDKELARMNGMDVDTIEDLSLEEVNRHVQNVYEGKPVFVTCGEKGIVTMDQAGTSHTPALQLMTRLDTVGAGDTTISALACCLAAGIKPPEAAAFANLAAAITVQKLFMTGTASGNEIFTLSFDPDYIYNPDLANDITKAYYLKGTNIEICNREIIGNTRNIKHVVFDHDGTLSTLRQGWDVIMRECMIRSITGGRKVDKKLKEKIEQRVMEYIEMSTGIQTIIQMEMLVDLVKEFKIIPEEKVLDKYGYKSVYNKSLLQMVNERLAKMEQGFFDQQTFKVRGVLDFLDGLNKRRIKLYLASGTDMEDVQREASIMGYAGFFDDRIYGSVNDIHLYSKKQVIESIIKENKLKENEFAVVGDGPVEIREGKKKRGITIGVSSDEEKGRGLNLKKRHRLINAGADIIIPDYTQAALLLDFLFN